MAPSALCETRPPYDDHEISRDLEGVKEWERRTLHAKSGMNVKGENTLELTQRRVRRTKGSEGYANGFAQTNRENKRGKEAIRQGLRYSEKPNKKWERTFYGFVEKGERERV
jgi:hypothetical protein